MIRGLLSRFSPHYAATLVYMLQSTEYQTKPYVRWYHRTRNFSTVAKRRTLAMTKAARLLALAARLGMLVQVLLAISLLVLGILHESLGLSVAGFVLGASYPFVWPYLLIVPLWLGRVLIAGPKERKAVQASEAIFRDHPGTTIAVAGSYGKTTMKELLLTVLSEGKKVAATPANKNVAISHAYFAQKLAGDEDILVIEYGEGAPGDVARFAATTHPDVGIITGLAPAHLDQYPSLRAAGEDIFSLARYVKPANTYVNADSDAVTDFLQPGYQTYTSTQALGWQISDVTVDFTGTSFVMQKDQQTIRLTSALLGRHQVGPLALVAALALQLGLTPAQVQTGIGNTAPFEHRMQPRALRGAWIIDDTYNGNIDGLKAGLKLLQDLPGKRKIYVTPGLVDQGEETERVHRALGESIAAANPDRVVLMHNSATAHIQAGLQTGNYRGEVTLESHPLEFYTNIEHVIASGDVVLMQNDWTDNYH